MKIRITEQTLRIRLSASDLQDLSTQNVIRVSLPIGARDFTIQLNVQQSHSQGTANTTNFQVDGDTEIHSDLDAIKIHIPSTRLKPWIESRETSLSTTLTYPNNRTLHLIVEKDYLG